MLFLFFHLLKSRNVGLLFKVQGLSSGYVIGLLSWKDSSDGLFDVFYLLGHFDLIFYHWFDFGVYLLEIFEFFFEISLYFLIGFPEAIGLMWNRLEKVLIFAHLLYNFFDMLVLRAVVDDLAIVGWGDRWFKDGLLCDYTINYIFAGLEEGCDLAGYY